MGECADEIQKASISLRKKVSDCPLFQVESLRQQVWTTFASRPPSNVEPLWNCLRGGEAIHDEEAWMLLGDLLGGQEVIVFFDTSRDSAGVLIPDGYTLETIIGECSGFVFYVTNRCTEFLLAFDDHDVLTACGTLASRLKAIRQS